MFRAQYFSKLNRTVTFLTANQGWYNVVANLSGNFKFTVGDALKTWNHTFTQHDISEPRESIENILMHVLNTKKYADVYKFKNKVLTLRELKEIDKLANMRLNRMPVQYLIGEWEFRDLNLTMRPPVFIPRPESEQLVELVLQDLRKSKHREVLELCCGCGAISLALLKAENELRVTALDKSKEACALTKENAEKNNLLDRLVVKEVNLEDTTAFPGILEGKKFHMVVGNPPYIPSGDLDGLQPEITLYEDKEALDGGSDGLRLIKIILESVAEIMHPQGKLYLETDSKHPEILRSWLKENQHLGLQLVNVYQDVYENLRFVQIIKN